MKLIYFEFWIWSKFLQILQTSKSLAEEDNKKPPTVFYVSKTAIRINHDSVLTFAASAGLIRTPEPYCCFCCPRAEHPVELWRVSKYWFPWPLLTHLNRCWHVYSRLRVMECYPRPARHTPDMQYCLLHPQNKRWITISGHRQNFFSLHLPLPSSLKKR